MLTPQTAAPAASPSLDVEWPDANAGARRRLRLIVLAVVGLLVAVGATVYVSADRIFTPEQKPNLELFTISRSSFPIILQEKGELRAAKNIQVRCEVEGRATIISIVDEGVHVKKGDLLFELASNEIDDKLRDLEIKVAAAKAAYEAAIKSHEILKDENASKIRKAEVAEELAKLDIEKYEKGEALELRRTAVLALEKAKSVLKRAKDTLKDSEELYKQGYITRIELENDRFAAYAAAQDEEKATLALEVLEKYTIPMALQEKRSVLLEATQELQRERKSAEATESKSEADVLAKKSEYEISQTKLAKIQDQKRKCRVVAPDDGLVVYARDDWWDNSSQVRQGAQVYEQKTVVELPDTSSMKVVVRVHEAQTERLKLGLPAVVEIEGFSGQRFTGKISKIAVLADSRSRWLNPNLKEYETEILLDGKFDKLKPGLTAKVDIRVTELKDVLAVPVQAVFGKGGKYFVFRDENGQAKPVEVRIGQSSTELVEIKEGIDEGQKIYLAVTDQMKALLPEGEGDKKGEEAPVDAASGGGGRGRAS